MKLSLSVTKKLKCGVGYSVIHSKFQSQPCLTIYHTNDETLEWLNCYNSNSLNHSKHTQSWCEVLICVNKSFLSSNYSKSGYGDN